MSLAAGPSDFGHYARRVWSESMVKPLGLGDMQIARYALDLSALPQPLITIVGKHPAPGRAPDPAGWKLRLTEAGKVRLQEALVDPVSDAAASRTRVSRKRKRAR